MTFTTANCPPIPAPPYPESHLPVRGSPGGGGGGVAASVPVPASKGGGPGGPALGLESPHALAIKRPSVDTASTKKKDCIRISIASTPAYTPEMGWFARATQAIHSGQERAIASRSMDRRASRCDSETRGEP